MDQNIKNRLVGVIVIFALAVIFLPMILDGSGLRKVEHEVLIPAQPLVSANPEFESKIVELQAGVEALPDPQPSFVDEQSPAETASGDGDSTTGAVARTVVEPAPVAEEEPPASPRTGGDSWVLQVGSFQDRDKALAQRDRLRKSDIAAGFIEQFELDGKSSYRVRLGPFLSREQSRVAQNKVKAKHDIDGIIMKYER